MNDEAPPRRWALLATALAGRPLDARWVRRACPAWAGSAVPDWVDLPLGGSAERWRLAVLRQALDLQPGGRWSFQLERAAALGLVGPCAASLPPQASDVERCLASWPRPVLLRRLWWAIDRERVDALIRQRYPGARAALGAGTAWPPAWPAELQAPVQAGTGSAATVDDSLRAALALCAWLEGSRRGRRGRITPAMWTVDEVEGGEGSTDSRFDSRSGRRGAADAGADAAGRVDEDAGPVSAPAGPALQPVGGAARPGSAGEPPTWPEAAAAPRQPAAALPTRGTALDAQRHRHDEWDCHLQRYRRAWTCVHERQLPAADPAFLHGLRQRHAALSRRIRRRFAGARPAWRDRVRRAPDGDQLDLDAAIAALVDRRAGRAGDGRVYVAHPPARRDVCAALLLDMSGSTGFAIPDPASDEIEAADADEDFFFHAAPRRPLPPARPRRRVIDVARDAIGLMCEGLHGLGDRHAVFGFTGQGREQVDFHVAKTFDSPWSARSAAPLAAMQPGGATRTGAAIRHALLHLAREPARRKVLIVVTDGYPQDSDYGPDPADIDYGLHDTARALHEAARAGVAAFCISVDGAAHDHLRRMCPPQRYLVIDDVNDLPARLMRVYRQLTAR